MTDVAPGTIGLVPIGGDVGKGIRVLQWLYVHPAGDWFMPWKWSKWPSPDYEHAFVYLGDGKIIEAHPGGASIDDLSKYSTEDVFWCTSIASLAGSDVLARVVTLAPHFVGTGYSFLDYLDLVLGRLRLPSGLLQDAIADTHHMICSQLADWLYEESGCTLFANRWEGLVAPIDLYDKEMSLRAKAA